MLQQALSSLSVPEPSCTMIRPPSRLHTFINSSLAGDCILDAPGCPLMTMATTLLRCTAGSGITFSRCLPFICPSPALRSWPAVVCDLEHPLAQLPWRTDKDNTRVVPQGRSRSTGAATVDTTVVAVLRADCPPLKLPFLAQPLRFLHRARRGTRRDGHCTDPTSGQEWLACWNRVDC